MDISLVIPTYNEEKYISNCLKSVFNQKTNLKYEVIVVDNNSIDKTINIASDFKIKILKEKKQGVGAARRKGTENSKGNIVIHIDADTLIPDSYFEYIFSFFKKNKDIVCLGGQFKYYDAPKWKNFLRKIFYKPLYFFAKIVSRNRLGPTGGNMAFRNNFYKKTNGFNSNLKFGEDGDLTIQLSKFGKIFVDFNLICFVSVRRFNFNKSFLIYCLNFLSLCIFSKPFFNILDLEKQKKTKKEN